MKLDTLITTQKDYLRGLADAWLPLGATTMTLAGSQGMIWAWPAPPPPTDTEPALQAPIMAGRQRLGTLSIYGDVRSPLQAQIEAQALMLGQLLRLEYETDSLTTELIDQQDQLLALYDLARTLSLHVDLHPTLEALMKESARLVHCGGAFILMCTDDATTEIVFHCTHPEIVSSAAACRLSEMLTDTQTRMLVSQPEDNHGHLPAHIDNLLSLAVPIHGQKRGLLGLFNHPTGFTSPEIKLAEAIVDHASMQIEKTLLQEASVTQTRLQTEMELARQVQLKLLPLQHPQVTHLDLYGMSQSAWQVGGDFYDFIQHMDGSLAFVVGDVAGKGLSAALLMAMTRLSFRNPIRFLKEWTPSFLLARANADLYDDFTEVGSFATAFVGRYNAVTRQILYANAGHSPVIYCPRGGATRLLRADGTALGVLPETLSADYQLSLGPDDVLVVGTDGYPEAHAGDDVLFGYEPLLHLVETNAHRSAQAIAQAIQHAVAAFEDERPPADDRTLVVLKGNA